MNIFGRRLVKLRTLKNISASTLSKMLNVSIATIARWENGESEPMLSHIKMLAKIFEVSADYLVGTRDKRSKRKRPLVYPTLLRKKSKIV